MVTIELKGVKELMARLDENKRDRAVNKGMTESGSFLQRWIVRNRLVGPRPRILDKVTGNLARSITHTESEKVNGAYIVKVGTNIEYARIHEFGYGVDQQGSLVRGFIRRDKSKDEYIKTFVGGKLKKQRVITGTQGVGSHLRFTYMPARPFLRPSIEDKDNQNKILEMLTERLQEALEK